MAGKLPSFQFYPGDWRRDPNLRRCSKAARGLWIDLLCVMFECDERGVFITNGIPWTDEEIASAIDGNPSENLALLTELCQKGVARRRDDRAIFSKRMVGDERLRELRALAGSKGGSRPSSKSQANHQAKLQAKVKQTLEDEDEDEDEVLEGGVGETALPLRKPRILPCDEPELYQPAKAILNAYQDAVKPAHPNSGAIEVVIGLLASGVTEADLRAGAVGYAAWCAENDKEPQYRFSAKRFFSESAHEDFKDFKPAKSATPPIDPVYQESRRRLIERELRKRNGKPAAAAQY